MLDAVIKRHLLLGRRYLGRLYDGARALTPASQRSSRAAMSNRKQAIATLDRWSKSGPSGKPAARRVLIDGMWDNANYWIRYALLRRALHLTSAHETGLLGESFRQRVRATFADQGIETLVDYHALTKSSGPFFPQAQNLLANTRSAADILDWSLPHGFPGALVYDGVLKLQRRATVDLNDPLLLDYIAEALACIEVADRIVEQGGYDLVVLSHAVNYTYAALAWAAVRRRVPVLVLYGGYGTARFVRITEPDDLFAFPGCPSRVEMDALPKAVGLALARVGEEQLDARLAGQTGDIGSVHAYKNRQGRIDRQSLCAKFGWDPARPTIGIYASNWFDYPHASGLRDFQDFLDWMQVTVSVATGRKDVNWLFKSHPCDDWYPEIRGPRLDEMINQANGAHLRLVDKSWNGRDLIHCLDGIVTCHGTIALEAAALGKPVLTAYRGWYGHAGFSNSPRDRDDYIATLGSQWWTGLDADTIHRAKLFSGWYFCLPDWHGDYIYNDDSAQEANLAGLEGFLIDNAAAIAMEVETIQDWYRSDQRHYHVFKVGRARSFQTTHRAGTPASTTAPKSSHRRAEQVAT
jgi:hypothetical protein